MFLHIKPCARSCVLGLVFIIVIGTKETESDHPGNVSTRGDQSLSYFFYQTSGHARDCLEVVSQCSSSNSSGVHPIKPDGYSEAFDVYCDTEGYMVIKRRRDNSISFNRTWEEYESGFGFFSNEFWLGNKRLSYLTNQKKYQLRLDVTLLDGSSFYMTYDSFRISDGYNDYGLVSVGQYEKGSVMCPTNMVPGNCTCQIPCAYPESCIGACHVSGSCVCPGGFLMNNGHCIPRNQCGCFIANATDKGIILQEGGIYFSQNCSTRCSCTSGQLDCEEDFQCSDHGTCDKSKGGWNCSCIEGYEGDGVQCTSTVREDCQDIFDNGQRSSGVYSINPGWSSDPFQVYCNMANGGGWMVFQRQNGEDNFYRSWSDYKNGFGSLTGAMWLGNDKIYQMTNQKDHELRIDFTDRDGIRYYATYSLFRINAESDKYRLASVGTYAGTTGDSLTWHVNKKFSTRDQDNDDDSHHCAAQHQGGWWFGYHHCYNYCNQNSRSNCVYSEHYCDFFPVGSGCATCAISFLNGNYGSSVRGRNIHWSFLSGYDCGLQYTEMKIRPL